MPTRKLPRLYKLEPGQILEVVRDLNYFSLNYNIILVPDAHELYDYCFPINPADEYSEIEPESLAESQVALNYLFKAEEPDRPPVVLLDEYKDELKRLMDTIFRESNTVYKNAELISRLIQTMGLHNITANQAEELESVVQKNFQFLLTILMGIHSIGTLRMNEVYDKGLTEIYDAVRPEDVKPFKKIWNDYRRTNLYGIILKALEADNARRGIKATSRTEYANRNDASAIDRLIYLNVAVDNASRTGPLKNNYLFLYISDAAKSSAVFRLPEVRSALPVIKGRSYAFWRNRHQVLAYVIYRSRGADKRENILKTAKALRSLDALLKRVKEFEQVFNSKSKGCRECILEGKTPGSCVLLTYCQEVESTANKIKAKREEVTNWGLFQQISSYTYLRESQLTKLNLDYGIYIQLFADIIESRKLTKDIALERMYQRHLWIYRASEWTLLTNRIKEGFDSTKELDLRAEKDQVTGIDQHLPCNPKFESAQYKEIINLVLGFYRQPKRVDLFDEAYRKFLDLEPAAKQDDEYDLLRAYLYLAFSFEDNIHSYIKEILVPKVEEGVSDYARRESLYVLCWSARRAGLFGEADKYSLQGIEQFPYDPRFFHGRALNIYGWLRPEVEAGCPYQITDAIADSERALELYKLHEAENVDVIGTCHNNIAYFLALDVARDAESGPRYSRQERALRLEQAKEHVEKLESVIDKETLWNPAHPEFFHTEAFLEYQLALHHLIGSEWGKEELIATLKSARENIQTAIDIYAPSRYVALKSQIDKLLGRLK